mmetsp:Transcript_6012/g.10285  ORF Transcript_6012/g.10285 Transcript_6012/m.10285 type:complete len:424 (-) Transcript_6012:354-1625(-)
MQNVARAARRTPRHFGACGVVGAARPALRAARHCRRRRLANCGGHRCGVARGGQRCAVGGRRRVARRTVDARASAASETDHAQSLAAAVRSPGGRFAANYERRQHVCTQRLASPRRRAPDAVRSRQHWRDAAESRAEQSRRSRHRRAVRGARRARHHRVAVRSCAQHLVACRRRRARVLQRARPERRRRRRQRTVARRNRLARRGVAQTPGSGRHASPRVQHRHAAATAQSGAAAGRARSPRRCAARVCGVVARRAGVGRVAVSGASGRARRRQSFRVPLRRARHAVRHAARRASHTAAGRRCGRHGTSSAAQVVRGRHRHRLAPAHPRHSTHAVPLLHPLSAVVPQTQQLALRVPRSTARQRSRRRWRRLQSLPERSECRRRLAALASRTHRHLAVRDHTVVGVHERARRPRWRWRNLLFNI